LSITTCVIEHEFHVEVGIPIQPDGVGGLLAAAIGGGAAATPDPAPHPPPKLAAAARAAAHAAIPNFRASIIPVFVYCFE
jgi:hypothetical protein